MTELQPVSVDTDPQPVDATHGLRDWSDDVAALVRTRGWTGDRSVHIAGWSLGGGIVQQYDDDRPLYAANAPDADEDVLLEEFLKTVCGDDNYPGTVVASGNRPGMAPGDRGGQNAMSPRYCDTSAFADIDPKPHVLWVWGTKDTVVSDASALDFAVLGRAGVVPGWPGEVARPLAEVVSAR